MIVSGASYQETNTTTIQHIGGTNEHNGQNANATNRKLHCDERISKRCQGLGQLCRMIFVKGSLHVLVPPAVHHHKPVSSIRRSSSSTRSSSRQHNSSSFNSRQHVILQINIGEGGMVVVWWWWWLQQQGLLQPLSLFLEMLTASSSEKEP